MWDSNDYIDVYVYVDLTDGTCYRKLCYVEVGINKIHECDICFADCQCSPFEEMSHDEQIPQVVLDAFEEIKPRVELEFVTQLLIQQP